MSGMTQRAVVVPPGQGTRYGNVEFLARTADTPRFTFGIIEIVPGRHLETHVHADEDDAFYILEGELTFEPGHARHVRARAAGRPARLHQPRRRAGADAQSPRARGLRSADRRRQRRLSRGEHAGARVSRGCARAGL